MTIQELFNAYESNIQVYTMKRFFNGDYVPVKGYIREIKLSPNFATFTLVVENELAIKDINVYDAYLEEELPKLKERINNIMLEHLPLQIQELESKLAERKRKLNKLLEEKKNEQ